MGDQTNDQLLREAMALLAKQPPNAASLNQAGQRFSRILQSNPQNAAALGGLGVVLLQTGQPARAADALKRAGDLAPQNADYPANLGLALVQLKRMPDAIKAWALALERKPGHLQARINVGLACLETGAIEEAKAHLTKAFKKAPKNLDVVNGLAVAQARSGAPKEAVRLLTRALGTKGTDRRLLGNLISAQRVLGDLEAALEACDRLRASADGHQASPIRFETELLRGQILKDLGDLEEAGETLSQLSKQLPKAAAPRVLLASVLRQQGKMDSALKVLDEARSLEPGNRTEALERAETLREIGRGPDAISEFQTVLSTPPAEPRAYQGLAVTLQNLGRFDEALAVLKDFRKAFPQLLMPLKLLSENQKFSSLPIEADAMRAMLKDESRTVFDRSQAGFALGKILDDIGDFDQAFSIISEANHIAMMGQERYDPDQDEAKIQALIAAFAGIDFPDGIQEAVPLKGPKPVFVVGMPRSGTTLFESILAAHPQARGLGELRLISTLAGTLYPEQIAKAVSAGTGEEMFAEMRQRYLDRLAFESVDCAVAIDKMPGNHLYLALIRQLFPEAVIFNCLREPRDVALSMLFQPFTANHPASETLYFLGRRCRNHETLSTFWRQLFGPWFKDVAYADVVEDMEGSARFLLEACGLDWDESVLAFHDRKSSIYSASKWQARQPIFKTSLARWKRYEAYFDAFEAGYAGESWDEKRR